MKTLSLTAYENHPKITQKHLRELFSYDPSTGLLTWKVTRSRLAKIGDEAGTVDRRSGHVLVTLYGHKIPAHRLVWMLVEGAWPERLMCRTTDPTNLSRLNWMTSEQAAMLSPDPAKRARARARAQRWNEKRAAANPDIEAARDRREAERAERAAAIHARDVRRAELDAARPGPNLHRRRF